MSFNFYAETSFTEICGWEYFGVRIRRNTVRIRSCPTTGVREYLPTIGIQSYQQQQCQQCTLFCYGLKNFSAKGMSDVTSDTDCRMVSWFQNQNWQ